MDIGKRLVQLEAKIARLERSSRLANASLDDAALEVRDAGGSLRAVVGQQPDGTTAVNVVNGPTPPVPAAPTVEPALAALAVTWNGTFAGGAVAPLDWMRCEVHVGPIAGFTPDQGTLRDTIESPQGGTVTIPLPYTEWFVKLRSRTTSGVASAATAAVAATPRKAAAADITAGAVTAQALAADAITGKTVTGGLVTGAIVQTSASGQRVVLNPQAPDPEQGASSTDTVAGVEVHSGAAAQVTPGVLVADVDDTPQAYPYTGLHSPSLKRDGMYGFPITAHLRLLGPQTGVRGGSIFLEANSALSGTDQRIGNVTLYGATGNARTDTSLLTLYCENGDQAAGGNGTGLGARSWVQQNGAQVQLRAASTAGDVSFYVRPTGVEATGTVTAPNITVGTSSSGAVQIRDQFALTGQADSVNVSFTSQTSHTQAVTFPRPFTTAPIMTVSIASGAGVTGRFEARAFNITTTGFTLFILLTDTAEGADTWSNIPVHWIAVTPQS